MRTNQVSGWLLTLAFLVHGCGNSVAPVQDSDTDGEPPPPVVKPDDPVGPGNYKLEKFAKISSVPNTTGNYAADNIADGWLQKEKGTQEGFVWIPGGSVNNSSVTLKWNGPVSISKIRLFDNPKIGDQITRLELRFFDETNEEKSIVPITVSDALPDDGKTGIQVSGPSSEVTQMTVVLLDHILKDKNVLEAGLGEVQVLGHHMDKATEEKNISEFAQISEVSSVLDAVYESTDTGKYRSTMVKDGLSTTGWISNGNGKNAFIVFEFDRPYEITKINLKDLSRLLNFPGKPEIFTKATVHFLDINKRTTEDNKFGTAKFDYSADPKISKKVRIEVTSCADPCGSSPEKQDNETGFSEVEIFGKYTPEDTPEE